MVRFTLLHVVVLAGSLVPVGPPAPVGALQSAEEAAAEDSVPPMALVVARVEGSGPRLDGVLDDESWREASRVSGFVQSEPSAGEPATERTEVRVVRANDALFIGVRLVDSSAETIRAPLARRDEDVYSDWFTVFLDPSGEGRAAVALEVNPRGVKRDFRIGEDGRADPDWDAIWDVAVSVDPGGWTAELRIPFSQLHSAGPPNLAGSWGVNFRRHLARSGEFSSWAPYPRNPRRVAASLGEMTGLEGVRSSVRLEVIPYSMGRATTPSGGPDEPRPFFGTVGGDLQVGLPAGLTFSATLNPDFGQVEADPAVVNVSGYRTFFPEKRPFFLEDRELFSHEVGRTRLFHSRRIGRDVQPTAATRSSLQQVPDASGILAASKLSGRTPGGWTVGVLHALTNAEMRVSVDSLGVETLDPVEPRTNYLVARLARSRGDGRGSLGGLVTFTRRDLRGTLDQDLPSMATAGGVTWYRQSEEGGYQLSGALLGSRVEGSAEVVAELQRAHGRYFQRPDAAHLEFDSARTGLSGFAADAYLAWHGDGNWTGEFGGQVLSPGFEVNDLGHQRESDRAHQFAQVSYDRLGEGLIFRRRRLTLTQWSDWSFGRERLGTGGRAHLQLQLRNFWTFILQGERHLPALSPDQLRGGPALVMPGSNRARAILVTDPRRSVTLRLDGSVTREDETEGTQGVFRATLEARPAGRVLVALEPSLVERLRDVQYVTGVTDGDGRRFIFGRANHRTLSFVSRLDLALSPTLTLQFYAQPYLVTRRMGEFKEVVAPRASRFEDRFRSYAPGQVNHDAESERVHVDRDGDGTPDFSLPDPSFTYGQLSSNFVLRWEYRPGSTLFVVWSRDVRDRAGSGSLRPMEGFTDLMGFGRPLPSPATNLLLVKATFRFSP